MNSFKNHDVMARFQSPVREFPVRFINQKHRYPWRKLTQLGDYFVTDDHDCGVSSAANYCYAKNKKAGRLLFLPTTTVRKDGQRIMYIVRVGF